MIRNRRATTAALTALIASLSLSLPEQGLSQSLVNQVDWQAIADATLGAGVGDGQIPGAVVVVVDQNGSVFDATYGVGQIESQSPVTDTTLFEVGSIGKVLTAMAVLKLADEGRLGLDVDVNEYLGDWQLTPPGTTPLTLHHLLTHSAGLNDRAIGYAVRGQADLPTLCEFLSEHFPTFFAEPGQFVSYSNYGYGLAGLIVESSTGTPFADYVATEILGPLDIERSGYAVHGNEATATGYLGVGDEFRPTPTLRRPVSPAGSLVASASDMAKLLVALLNDGGAALGTEPTKQMLTTQLRMHPVMMGNTYGLEESRWGKVVGYGKGGSVPGFTSYMAVLPEHGVALFAVVNSSQDAPIDSFILETTRHLSGAGDREVRKRLPDYSTIDVSSFAGEYSSNRYDRTSIEKLLNLEVHQIYATEAGNLSTWHDGTMNTYQPVEELVFQHESDPDRILAFKSDANGEPTHAYFNDRIAGGYVPVVWEKNGFWNSNRYVNEIFGIPLIGGLGYLVWPLVAAIGLLMRRWRPTESRRKDRLRALRLHAIGFISSALLLAYAVGYFLPLLRQRSELVFGVPAELAVWGLLPPLIIASFAVYALLWVTSLRRLPRAWLVGPLGFMFIICGVLVTEFLIRWNLV